MPGFIFWITLFLILSYLWVVRPYLKNKKLIRLTQCADYAGYAKIVGGNHPLLGSTAKNIVLAIKNKELIIMDTDGAILLSSPIKNVKAETTTVSASTSAGLFFFGLMNLGAKEQLLQLEIYDENSKEAYKCLFKDAGFRPDWVNKERYNYLVQENEGASV